MYLHFLMKQNILHPDIMHLHSLVYRFLLIKFFENSLRANYMSTIIISIFLIFNAALILKFFDNQKVVIFALIFFIMTYEFIYYTISRKLNNINN